MLNENGTQKTLTASPIKPLRIAFITEKLGSHHGGAEAYGVMLMKTLAKRHDITVIGQVFPSSPPFAYRQVVITVPRYLPSWLRTYWAARKTAAHLKKQDVDIVHSHVNGWVGDVDVLHVKSVRYHHITRHASWFRKFLNYVSPRVLMYLWLEKQRIHNGGNRHTVVVSPMLKEQVQMAYRADLPIDVITPGVCLPSPQKEPCHSIRKALGIPEQQTVGILVARDPMRKGLQVMIDILPELPMHLLVVGPDAAWVNAFQENHPVGLRAKLHLVAQTNDMSPYYRAANFCVFPTLDDSFGMVPLEAMSYGLPVMISQEKYCGFAHYVEHAKNALVLDNPNDAEAVKHAIVTLLSDRELYQRLQEEGKQLAQQFSWENIAQQFEHLYRQIEAASNDHQ